MKKTFRYLSMATLAVVAGFLTAACSNDDYNMEPSQAPHHVVTSKVTVNMADTDDATRALNPDWTKTFVVGDKISVRYKNIADKYVRAVSEALTADDILPRERHWIYCCTKMARLPHWPIISSMLNIIII